MAVSTAEGLYPFTGVKDLTLDISLARGVIGAGQRDQLGDRPRHQPVRCRFRCFAERDHRLNGNAETARRGLQPSNSLSFTLIGDPSNPNGGLLRASPALSVPSLGITFGTSTPSNDFPTTIWTLEYDGFADFPQYPIDFFADLNALAGIPFVHGTYLDSLDHTACFGFHVVAVGSALHDHVYDDSDRRICRCWTPLRALPVIGNPLADLVQPDLKELVNWGYGDPDFGWSTGPADVPTPFGFLPPLSATTALGPVLVSGTQQGVGAFVNDLSAEVPTSLPALSVSSLMSAVRQLAARACPACPGVDAIDDHRHYLGHRVGQHQYRRHLDDGLHDRLRDGASDSGPRGCRRESLCPRMTSICS